jgi:hypothetical protein
VPKMSPEALVLDGQRSEAFDALVGVVDELSHQHRLCYAASLKPRLQKQLPSFSEAALGYASFRAFLTDAERAGRVHLTLTRGGDVEVTPPGGASVEIRRIRPDFWQAATDDAGDRRYFYDPQSDRVITRTAEGESESGLVVIPNADTETQEGWISAFLATPPQSQSPELAEKVAAASTLSKKIEILNRDSGAAKAWHQTRLDAVRELLEKWASEHDLTINLVDRSQKPARPRPTQVRRLAKSGGGEERLRERLHRAIDRMPPSELLRLPIPIEYIVDV